MLGGPQASCAPWKCTHNLSLVEPEALGFGFRSRAPQGIGMHRWHARTVMHTLPHIIIYNIIVRTVHFTCTVWQSGRPTGTWARPLLLAGGVGTQCARASNYSATPGHTQSRKDCVEVSGLAGLGNDPHWVCTRGWSIPLVPNAR